MWLRELITALKAAWRVGSRDPDLVEVDLTMLALCVFCVSVLPFPFARVLSDCLSMLIYLIIYLSLYAVKIYQRDKPINCFLVYCKAYSYSILQLIPPIPFSAGLMTLFTSLRSVLQKHTCNYLLLPKGTKLKSLTKCLPQNMNCYSTLNNMHCLCWKWACITFLCAPLCVSIPPSSLICSWWVQYTHLCGNIKHSFCFCTLIVDVWHLESGN